MEAELVNNTATLQNQELQLQESVRNFKAEQTARKLLEDRCRQLAEKLGAIEQRPVEQQMKHVEEITKEQLDFEAWHDFQKCIFRARRAAQLKLHR